MKEITAAQRYARALFLAAEDAARKDKGLFVDKVRGELEAADKLIRTDRKLGQTLAHALFPFEQKSTALRKALSRGPGHFSPVVLGFFDLLLRKKRMGLLPLIAVHFSRRVDDSRNVLKAYVKSAAQLDPKAVREIEKSLSALLGKKAEVELSVDPSLLAGVTVKAGDTLIDNSLKSKLKNLKSRLVYGH